MISLKKIIFTKFNVKHWSERSACANARHYFLSLSLFPVVVGQIFFAWASKSKKIGGFQWKIYFEALPSPPPKYSYFDRKIGEKWSTFVAHHQIWYVNGPSDLIEARQPAARLPGTYGSKWKSLYDWQAQYKNGPVTARHIIRSIQPGYLSPVRKHFCPVTVFLLCHFHQQKRTTVDQPWVSWPTLYG